MLLPDFDFELSLLPPGTRYILGIDEVGRGPWAGPVTVAGFILDLQTFKPVDFQKLKVRDSKTLNESQRLSIFSSLKDNFNYQILSASSEMIDEKGIGHAIEDLMLEVLDLYSGQYDFALIDGNQKIGEIMPCLPCEGKVAEGRKGFAVVDADARCFSVAAASVMAKVTRDLLMADFDTLYPHYDFKNNKGYGTRKHQEGLKNHGPCPIHRRSYKPIQKFLEP